MPKIDLNGMLVTTPEDQEKKRRARIEENLAGAEHALAELKRASMAEFVEANALKVAADTRAHECDARERIRLRDIDLLVKQVECFGREISKLQAKITEAEQGLVFLKGEVAQKVELDRVLAAKARIKAEETQAVVERKYGRRLRDAEKEVERQRLKLTRLELRTSKGTVETEVQS